MHANPTPPPGPELALRAPRHRIERRAIRWWMLRALLRWGIVLAALVVAAVLWQPARVWLAVPIVAAALALLVTLFVEPRWRFSVHRWEITDHAAYSASGWLVREWRVAPVSRIQTVDAVRGPLEQLLGLATLRVTTASSYGSINIRGLDHATAEEAATRLAKIAEIIPGDAT